MTYYTLNDDKVAKADEYPSLWNISVLDIIVHQITTDLCRTVADNDLREKAYVLNRNTNEFKDIAENAMRVCGPYYNIFFWKEETKLFAYLCWYVTEICEKNGLRAYKGKKGSVNLQLFKRHFVNDFKIDRKQISAFKLGDRPKKYELIESVTKNVLSNILNKEIKTDIPNKLD